jgi:hypothetical protein
MPGFNRWHLLTGLAATLCMGGIVSLALIYFFPAPPSKIAIASSVKGGAFETLAQRYRERLAGFHVTLDLRPTAGGIDRIQNGQTSLAQMRSHAARCPLPQENIYRPGPREATPTAIFCRVGALSRMRPFRNFRKRDAKNYGRCLSSAILG